MSGSAVRSPELGVIGVGDSTTPNLLYHHQLFSINRALYRLSTLYVLPTWKLGINFIWGATGRCGTLLSRSLMCGCPSCRGRTATIAKKILAA